MAKTKLKSGHAGVNAFLTELPVLGWFFRKIKANQSEIKTALATGKTIEGETKQSQFIGGLITIVSGRIYKVLEDERIIKANANIEKGKLKAKVKYPLVGEAELELGKDSKIKAIVKAPFIASAKLLGALKLKRSGKK